MAKAENYNKWSGIKDIKLPKGGVVLKLCDIKEDPEPENKGRFIIPNVLISPTDRIYKDNVTYDIASIANISASGEASFDVISINGSSAGLMRLKSGNPKDERLWKFLSLTSQNGSNPQRDTSVAPKFFVFDAKKEASEAVSSIKLETEVLTACFSMNLSTLKKLVTELGLGESSEEVMLQEVVNIAKKKPGTVKAAIDAISAKPKKETSKPTGKPKKTQDLIVAAFKSGVLVDSKESKEIHLDGDVVLSYEDKVDTNKLVALFDASPELLEKIK